MITNNFRSLAIEEFEDLSYDKTTFLQSTCGCDWDAHGVHDNGARAACLLFHLCHQTSIAIRISIVLLRTIFTALRNDVYIRYNQNFNTLKFFSSCATFDDNTFAFKQQTRINAILLLNITSRIESIVLKNDRYVQIQKFTLYDTRYFRIYTFEKQKAGRYDGFFFPLSRYVMNNARDAKIARNASCASLTATAESKRIESVTVSRVEQARERERKKERNAYDWREQR